MVCLQHRGLIVDGRQNSWKTPMKKARPAWQLTASGKKRKRMNIDEHQSYQGVMTGETAQLKFQDKVGNYYLTRYSEERREYVLSVSKKINSNSVIFQHFFIKITTTHDRSEYEIEGAEKKFDDISELLRYYEANAINDEVEDIGKCYIPEAKRILNFGSSEPLFRLPATLTQNVVLLGFILILTIIFMVLFLNQTLA